MEKCIINNCGKLGQHRGMCQYHYGKFYYKTVFRYKLREKTKEKYKIKNSDLNLLNDFKNAPINLSGLYIIYNYNEIIYIGASRSNVFSRVRRHRQGNWSYTHIKYLFYDKNDILDIEARLINHFKPRHNTPIFYRNNSLIAPDSRD